MFLKENIWHFEALTLTLTFLDALLSKRDQRRPRKKKDAEAKAAKLNAAPSCGGSGGHLAKFAGMRVSSV